MVAMRVGDEDMRHRLAAHRIEQCRDMRRIVRARIDDRYLAASDDVADRAFEGERARVVRDDAAYARGELLGAAGRQLEHLIIWDVVSHARVAHLPAM